jgi:hypothetical protein
VNITVHPTKLCLTLALILFHQSVFADYQTGLDAYNNKDYATALHEWKTITTGPPATVSRAVLAETNYAIGMLYWQGQGVAADYGEAFTWLQKAANMGHAGAQDKLGYLYTEGIGVAQDYATAFEWFKKAAEQGSVDGQYNLGIFYLNGWGTEQDVTMAAQYLAAASAQGDVAAEQELQKILPLIAAQRGDDVVVMDETVNAEAVNAEAVVEKPAAASTQAKPILLPESWILAQDPNSYTIQVIGLRSKSALENLVRGYDQLAPFASYTLQRNNKPLYMLLQGVYPNVESARTARNNFPKGIQKPKDVWIRQFGKIQQLIHSPR